MAVVLCSRKCLSVLNNKGLVKLCVREVQFLYTALLLIEIYLPVKFQVDTVAVLCSVQNTGKFSVKQLGQLKPNSIWHHHGIGVKMESLLSIFFSLHMFFM